MQRRGSRLLTNSLAVFDTEEEQASLTAGNQQEEDEEEDDVGSDAGYQEDCAKNRHGNEEEGESRVELGLGHAVGYIPSG